jgi:2',5'-phosphodiesterase
VLAILQDSMHAALLPLLRASPQLVDALQRVGTIAQLVLLRPVGSSHAGARSSGGSADGAQRVPPTSSGASDTVSAGWEHSLCVLNTHLFFHPKAPHIRTLHVAAALAEADSFIAEVTHASGGRGATVCSVHLKL